MTTDELLIDGLSRQQWAANGVPEAEQVRAAERAVALVVEQLGDLIVDGGVRTSPLGAGWSRDLDVHVRELPDEMRLQAAGWHCLDGLERRLGHDTAGRWAIREDGEVLAGLDLQVGPPPDRLQTVLSRSQRRGEVRLREVLELRVLQRSGEPLPDHHPVVRAAASAEAALGGDELAAHLHAAPALPPVTVQRPAHVMAWHRVRRLVAHGRRRRVVVAISGADGAGKSTLVRRLSRDLDRAALPTGVVWSRPGMRLEFLEPFVLLAKRLLGHEPDRGVRRVAEGEPVPSRLGVVGFLWSLIVTLAYLRDVRGRHRRTRGIVLYDRHLLDALVTLDVLYAGSDPRLQRWLVRRFLPPADLSVYLRVTPDVALGRKPDDLFSDVMLRAQLERYEARLDGRLVVALDGEGDQSELAREVFDLVCALGREER